MKSDPGKIFIITGLFSLAAGLLCGLLGSFYFLDKSISLDIFPFYKLRPLHVTLVISWILLSAIGCIYVFLRKDESGSLLIKLQRAHFGIFITSGIAIILSYLFGNFGGKEYLEFPFYLQLPICFGWILFAVILAMSVNFKQKKTPVYIWMWFTGSVFMVFHLAEANLWHWPFFGHTIVKDLTIQWKSNGAMVGSWNMLVYGIATYVMSRIYGNTEGPTQPLAYSMYFLGLTNLLFNWGHHIYPLPGIETIKIVSYVISMSEWIILFKMMRDWRTKSAIKIPDKNAVSGTLLALSERWIFINLCLAILMSVPAINLFTHGTHITVAHSMGTTIGINTLILLAGVFYIIENQRDIDKDKNSKQTLNYIRLLHYALLTFFLSLIIAGLIKGILTYHSSFDFHEIMNKISPFLIVFSISGLILIYSVFRIIFPLIREYVNSIK